MQATYTLTGESRGYKSGPAIADIIKPKNKGGAYELVARYDWLTGDVDGSPEREVSGIRVGLNWYANKNVRFGVNYLFADSDNIVGNDEDGNAVGVRAQLAF